MGQSACKGSPEQGLLALRKGLGLYANLRPVKTYPALLNASPLKPEFLREVDMIVVRELTGGLYFGEPKGRKEIDGHVHAVDTLDYADYEIERIVELAFQLAGPRRKKVTSVDKANVLESSRLWRQTAAEVGKKHPSIALENMLVDTAAMRLITSPKSFDVVVTENTFGDILTDEASILAGSMGMLPSRLTFHGGIDVQRLMPFGSIGEIRENARTTIEVLGENGGYFFSPSHRFQPDTPLENIDALYQTALEYGSYR